LPENMSGRSSVNRKREPKLAKGKTKVDPI
jgi:hypothetical protein